METNQVTETIHVGGMMCAACVRTVERVVSKIDGVNAAAVNLATETLRVTYDGCAATMDAVKQAIRDQDYEVIEPDALDEVKSEPWLNETRRLICTGVLAALLMCVGMGPMMGLRLPAFMSPHVHMLRYGMIQMLLALAVMVLNLRVYRTGFKTLFKGAPGMDSLIAVSTAASFLYSCWGLIRMPAHGMSHHDMDLYFESCGTILAFVLLGKYMEGRAKRKTNAAVQKLRNLAPETAVILNGEEQLEVPLKTVLPDDLVLVKPGERIPVDGVVVRGRTQADESMLTGESALVEKSEGDRVIGGSQNADGMIVVKTEKTGADTVLSQIIRMVQDAQGTKAPIARLADQIAGIFVPAVMSIAVLAALIWFLTGAGFPFALRIFVTVLVIACPCALGLATPTAVMVGTGAAAERGLLFKDGETLERLSSVKRVVFDKTGTITEGKPHLTGILTVGSMSESELLVLAASAEQYSEHALAKAIVNAAKERDLSLFAVDDFSADPGRGIHAVADGRPLIIGNQRQLREGGIDFSAVEQAAEQSAAEGNTTVFLALDGQIAGMFSIADVIRPNSKAAVETLRVRGAEAVMLTGDQQGTAERVAALASIREVYAGVLPGGKADTVRSIGAEYGTVAMVGDGINDAPALAAADIGIAVASGTDIAIEAADLVLMKNDPMDVVRGIEISAVTLRNIKQNLFWAFIFNCLGIPVAAGVLYLFGGPLLNPMIAAAAMSCSSVLVVSNALRIRGIVARIK